MNISFNTRDPVYLQVIRHVKLLIARGELEGGDTIPSRRELATSLKINPNTVQRAYKEMEEAQLIHTERNKPSTITSDQAILSNVRRELLRESVHQFLEEIAPLQLSMEELMSLVEEEYSSVRRENEDD
ncbi:GntR family transcriptional regulator [Geomicrobium sediminis]|uniref:DNA-binding transcriptional regulator YhcF (GntR family) n=1 Tax=Geomicrobium sediminis TaxID=1347788 RepID=A0ABS2PA39_9BACL|nr:GntR family transcriptional regulator [Geomicrobium sediminis]MBM7632174.1 DNA-binding transcriptional regulator YhcF (GntR family) [Geomicrobium sediminis]